MMKRPLQWTFTERNVELCYPERPIRGYCVPEWDSFVFFEDTIRSRDGASLVSQHWEVDFAETACLARCVDPVLRTIHHVE